MNFQGRPDNEKSYKKKYNYKKLSLASLAICVLLSTILVYTNISRKNDLKKSEEVRELYYSKTLAPDFNKGSEAQISEPHKIQKNFEPLLKINPETVGWIKAGGLADEPVVYRDNDYYLHHDFEGQKNSSGTVFIDVKNSNWDQDKYLVFYGHYRKDGGKFGNLKKYRDLQDLKDNLIVEWTSIYSAEPEKYLVFSVFDASMLEDNKAYFHLRRFEELKAGDGETQKLIEEVKKRSLFDIPLEVTPKDKIIVLVTCSYGNKDGKLLVFSRQVRPGEDADFLKKHL